VFLFFQAFPEISGVFKVEIGQQELVNPDIVFGALDGHFLAGGNIRINKIAALDLGKKTIFAVAVHGEGRNAEAEGCVGIDKLVVGKIVVVEQIFQVKFFAGIDGTGDLLIEHLEKVLDPEPVIDKQVFTVFILDEKPPPFEIIDNIFDDKYKGLSFGSGKTENPGIEFVEI
jgi:hypothetical protein